MAAGTAQCLPQQLTEPVAGLEMARRLYGSSRGIIVAGNIVTVHRRERRETFKLFHRRVIPLDQEPTRVCYS